MDLTSSLKQFMLGQVLFTGSLPDVHDGRFILPRSHVRIKVYNNALSDINKVDFTVDSELVWNEDSDLGKVLSKWYADFVSKRLTTPGLCYSVNRYVPPPLSTSASLPCRWAHQTVRMRDGNRKAFISRADVRAVLPFRPEEYADLAELQALVRLVGPYGVRAIHRETMKFVASNIPAMKDVLALNRKTLSDIGSSYSKDVTIHMKALKEIDTFINRYTRISTPKEDH
jgi:hypothetical protein